MFVFYDRVAIAATDPLLLYVACLGEFGDDSNRSAFRNSDSGRYVPHANFRVAHQADDDVAMVAQKRPPERRIRGSVSAAFCWPCAGFENSTGVFY